MQPVYIDPKILRRQQWQQIWPISYLAVIAISQMLLTCIIIGTETRSMALNMKYSFLFVGYNAAFLFTITWISTFIVVCCKQESRGYATHVLIANILSVIASSILLYCDARFLQEPWTCLWPGNMCFDTDWDFIWSTWWNNNYIDNQHAKLIAIKTQLSCAAIMLALNVIFIVIYIYTSLKVRARLTIIDPQNPIELNSEEQIPPPPPPISNWLVQPSVWHPQLNI